MHPSFAQELKINSAKSLIEFNHVEEQTIGTIKGVSGKINFDVTNLSNSFFEARVDISSIKTSKAENITSAWIKRWLVKRITREETLNKLVNLGPDSIHQKLFYETDDISENLFNISKAK